MKRNNGGNYTNPCLTMHQPWASLLIHGIKRVEGRSWPSPIRGRLWIHAASKVPEPETIKAMEDFYREIYAVNGVTDLKFSEIYPISRLLGFVEVVGCIKCEELRSWEELPEGVRLEGQTDYCWLCEKPQKLLILFEMRGIQGVYNLEKKIYEPAVRGLRPVEGPYPVNFPIPDPQDPFSLKPGSLQPVATKAPDLGISPSLSDAVAGARVVAAQVSIGKKNDSIDVPETDTPISARTRNKLKGKAEDVAYNDPDDAVSNSSTKDKRQHKQSCFKNQKSCFKTFRGSI